jgi:hypothetical protein
MKWVGFNNPNFPPYGYYRNYENLTFISYGQGGHLLPTDALEATNFMMKVINMGNNGTVCGDPTGVRCNVTS